MEVRPPYRSELHAVSTLLCSNGWEHRLGDDAWLEELLAASHTMAAFEAGVLVGFARAVTDGLSNGYLSMVVVAEEHRRKGIGSRLVREITGNAPGVTWVLRASRPGARRFFERLGFHSSADAMERNRESRSDI